MAILKCKMCGGDLNLIEGETVAICEYCDTKQTVPTADNEKKMTLFARANRLRASCEFDKAAGVYESIVSEFAEEAEAYWGLVLCKYGIEYVDDPATGRKIPTCHRSSFENVMDDDNFEQVMENSDPVARKIYREEAKTIEDIRKGILEVSSKEEPYDIFICYKETDENGERTIDSVLAQDIYDMLTEHDYRVFFARITLEDKLGQEYEPYIFAALNSAKIMLAVGTDYEYYNAVWVKNEWSRFLQLIVKGEKKTLIPCYKNLDAYDMPKEFARLQAQDLGKVGAMQDLLRGIEKVFGKDKKTNTSISTDSEEILPLMKRAVIFLEDKDWDNADIYCEKILDKDPENAHAYLYKLMAEQHIDRKENLTNCRIQISKSRYYNRILLYADENLKAFVLNCEEIILNRNNIEKDNLIIKAEKIAEKNDEKSYIEAISILKSLSGWKNSDELADLIENRRKDLIIEKAEQVLFEENDSLYKETIIALKSILDWKNASDLIQQIETVESEYYIDFECPHCGEIISFTRWIVKYQKESVCPYCDRSVVFNYEE